MVVGSERSNVRECVEVWSLFLEYINDRPVIDGFVKKLDRVPLLNIAGGIINDYQYLWENYYFPSIPSLTTQLTLAASM